MCCCFVLPGGYVMPEATRHIIKMQLNVCITTDGYSLISVDDAIITDGISILPIGDHVKNKETVNAGIMRHMFAGVMGIFFRNKRENEDRIRRVTPCPFIGDGQ